MKFCPDEEELVLEIFKQLGSGNAIRDVPVRFRTKDGRIVNLLIDSNVKYDDAGNFAHTRCFIQDDTPRKIREAQAKLLLDETKRRSLKMLDNFMSRSMHHMRTPLHVLQTSMDIVSNYLVNIAKAVRHGDSVVATSLIGESQEVLDQAGNHVIQAVEMIEDISDLARLDQGQELELLHESIDLKELGKEVFGSTEVPANVEAALEFSGGPSYIFSDRGNLKKILRYLLDHVLSGAQGDEKRTVSLVIGQIGGNISFTILDSMHLIDSMHSMSCNDNYSMGDTPPDARGSFNSRSTDLPLIFQRYHQELVPDTSLDFEEAGDLRSTIEAGINSHRVNSIGIGLPLFHHLVRALGGDLRYSTQGADMTKFWFTLPSNDRKLEPERIVIETAKRGRKRSNFAKAVNEAPRRVLPEQVASCGLKALNTTSALVVEDVPMCAKLMCNILRQLGCSPTWVENGQEAIDKLRSTDGNMFDLVFMDLQMPVMDGLTATKILRDELKMQIPVVALTGDTGVDVKEQCGKIGFSEYCNKPLKRKDLSRIIERYTNAGARPN